MYTVRERASQETACHGAITRKNRRRYSKQHLSAPSWVLTLLYSCLCYCRQELWIRPSAGDPGWHYIPDNDKFHVSRRKRSSQGLFRWWWARRWFLMWNSLGFSPKLFFLHVAVMDRPQKKFLVVPEPTMLSSLITLTVSCQLLMIQLMQNRTYHAGREDPFCHCIAVLSAS